MEFDYNDKLSFHAEWYDDEVSYQKKFVLNFYPSDNTVELFDRELHRVYLKRTRMEELHMSDMFVDNTIRIYGRQVKITDYADTRTQRIVGKTKEHTFTIVKPSLVGKLGEVIDQIQNRGFQICKMKMCNLTRKEVLDLYEPYKGDSLLPFLLEHLVSGPLVAMELVGENALQRWLDELGPDDPLEGKRTAPNSLHALYGNDSQVENGFHAAKSTEHARREANFFFGEAPTPKASIRLHNTTCCVIKPHCVAHGKLGPVLEAIVEAKFRITALQLFYLSSAAADEFLQVYKGVVEDYHALLLSFVDGPCVALEVAGQTDDVDAHGDFRKICGPSDPDIARQIRPGTLRARFGCDKYRNAVHCTDLNEDTALEVEYFFKILDR
ncbi:nucleoside diphosphate kinase 7-like isoform X2 [Sitophilus oryzae]|nr:nucleoside diphosphate kinase 7-like isoform X2 [Sitophilus oryzae]XP_030766786.1 nucleoside diphosphate kinase 7-like isoform X2 [Sitophilus oryzae]XP_030766787.1 nucleoside diphosphate kinase 7-like isoform X2 [Sitophilus oryzae]XP_030766788.1 nucleoside diphosphate kinase 7-like isoform X2 [Sitophilus oryzae]